MNEWWLHASDPRGLGAPEGQELHPVQFRVLGASHRAGMVERAQEMSVTMPVTHLFCPAGRQRKAVIWKIQNFKKPVATTGA